MPDVRPSSLRTRVRATFAVSVVLVLVVLVVGVLEFLSLLDAREALVDRADPALRASADLRVGLLDEETGLRGYLITSDSSFLEPFARGQQEADDARAVLARTGAHLDDVPALLAATDRATTRWADDYVERSVAAARAGDPTVRAPEALAAGKARFDAVRVRLAALDRRLQALRADARDDLNQVTTQLVLVLAGAAVALVVVIGSLWALVRRRVEHPLERLVEDARQVAGGDLDHPVVPVGPAELQTLGLAMERMRQRIVTELATVRDARDELDERSRELARSNTELEQFAYVASHDLQEPLRKVASFCQLLQARYGGQLDERADQYIEFAVDGAKRMQALINDLLAFSRVGRLQGEAELVPAAELVARAQQNLAEAIAEAGATVEVGPLPTVEVEATLGVALFQNLIGNAVKFHRPGVPPTVRVSSRALDDEVELTVADDGIGIEPEYAERVFTIFQRLHAKDVYAGTGIGLSLCRKIVEHHGGRIWVDTDPTTAGRGPGTTIRFTLPVPEGAA